MGGFLSLGLKQIATYWRATGIDGFGEKTYSAPVQIKCRWEERSEFIRTADGNQVPSRARVFLEDDVALDDYLMLGKSTETDPRKLDNIAFQVMDFRKIPSLDATDFERLALL
jgi:hypothetical protein